MNRFTTIICAISLLVAMFFGFSGEVLAVRIHLSPGEISTAKGDEFKIDVLLGLNSEEVNAVEGTLVFDSDALFLVDTLEANSLVSFWVAPLKEEDERGRLLFSGIIPGGYSGIIQPEEEISTEGLLFSAVFRAREEGSFEVRVENPSILENDGQGSPLSVSVGQTEVSVLGEGTGSRFLLEDKNPPEIIEASIYEDPTSGDYFAVFIARDFETGISHYEIKIDGGEWVSAESPFLLGNDSPEKIEIKAVDKVGNVDIIKIEDRQKDGAFSAVLLILLALIAIVAYNRFYAHSKTKK